MKLRNACVRGILSLILLSNLANAQNGYFVEDPIAPEASGSVVLPPVPMTNDQLGYIWARGDFGQRPGVEGNFFTGGGFLPIQLYGPDSMFFAQSEFWATDEKKFGGNVGLGYRTYLGDYASVVGVNTFITGDHSHLENFYRRSSVGVEWFTNYLGVTANAYLPWDHEFNAISGVSYTGANYFEGNHLLLGTQRWGEQQTTGADIEIGSPIPRAEWLSLYAGAYTFDSDSGGKFSGVSGRAMVDLTSAILDFTVQNDDRFGTTFNVGAEFRLAGGPIQFTPRYRNLETQFYDRVRTRSRILTQITAKHSSTAALNPVDGNPYEFVHVDNTAANGGTGTDEARFNNLGLASNNLADIILVHRGTTSAGNLLQAGNGLIMNSNQLLLGEGVDFLLAVANHSTPVSLPDWSTSGASPFVTSNPNTSIVTIADNNTVMGLNMISPVGGNMIYGNGADNFFIQDINMDVGSSMTGPGGGIVLENSAGTGTIDWFVYRNTNVTTAAGGIVINNTNADPLALAISNAVIQGGQAGVQLYGNNSEIAATVNNVYASDNGTGLLTRASNGGEVHATVTNSQFNYSRTLDGIRVEAETAGVVTLSASNTIATNAERDGLNIDLNDATATVVIHDGDLTSAGDDALDINLANGAELSLQLQNTSGAGAGDDGMFVSATGGSTFQANVIDGSFNNAGGDGIVVELDNNSIGRLDLFNTDAANVAGGDAFRFNVANSSEFTAQLLGGVSLANASNGSAISGSVTGAGSTALINGNDVVGANAGGDAIGLFVDAGQLEFNLLGSKNFSNAGGDGLNLRNTNGGQATLNFSVGSLNLSNAGNNALTSVADGTGTVSTINLVGGANLDNAGGMVPGTGNAIHVESTDGAAAHVLGGSGLVSGANAARNGIYINADDAEAGVGLANAGSFAGAQENGIEFIGTNGANVTVMVVGQSGAPADFSNAATGAGVRGTLTNSVGQLALQYTNFDNAAEDGLGVAATNSTFSTQLLDSTFNNAGWNAIDIDALGGSVATVTGNNVSGQNAGGDGLFLHSVDGTVNATFANSNFDNAAGTGVSFVITDSDTRPVSTLTLDNTQADNAGADGLFAHSLNSAATVNIVNGSTFHNAGGNALSFLADGVGSSLSVTGNGVAGENAGTNAISAFAVNGSHLSVSLDNTGSFANSGMSGIVYVAQGGSHVNLSVLGSNSLPNGGDFSHADPSAIGFGVLGTLIDSSAVVTLSDLNFDNYGSGGFHVLAQNSQVVASSVTNTTFNNAGVAPGNSAISVVAEAGSQVGLGFTNVEADNADQNALHIVSNDSTFDITVSESSLNNAGANGALIEIEGAAPQSRFVTSNSTYNDATGDAIRYEANNAANMHIEVLDSELLNAGGASFSANQSGGSTVTWIIDPTLVNSGINFDILDGSTMNGRVIESPLTNKGVNGFANNNSIANISFEQGSTITNLDAGYGAVSVQANGGAQIGLSFDATSGDLSGSGADAIVAAAAGADSAIHINFAGDADLSGAQGDALALTAMGLGSEVNVTFGGNAVLSTAAAPTAGHGLNAVAANGGSILFDARNGLEVSDTQEAGLRGVADNGSSLDLRLNNFNIENAGASGIDLQAEGDSRIDLTGTIGTIAASGRNTSGHGLRAVTNGNNAASDSSLININLNQVDIIDNNGDGLNLVANHGSSSVGQVTPSSGIILNYTDGRVTGNHNPEPPVINQVGYGISATANGGGTTGDTTIILALTNVDLGGNEEGDVYIDSNNGGVVEYGQTGGTIAGPVVICANGNGTVASMSLDGVLITPSVDGSGDPDAAAVVLCALNDGQVFASFNNMNTANNNTAITGHGAQAVAFSAQSGGQIQADFNNVEMFDNLKNPALTGPVPAGHPEAAHFAGFGVEAVIQGQVTGSGINNSSATVNFNNVSVHDNAGQNGFQVDVTNGGEFNSTIRNLTLANNDAAAGEGEFQVSVDGAGSSANLDIDGLAANNSDGKGVNIVATNGAELNITSFSNVSANNAAEEGLNIEVTGGSTLGTPLTIENGSFANAGQSTIADAVNIDIASATSAQEITLTNVLATGASGQAVDINIDGTSAGGEHSVTLSNVAGSGAQGGNGLDLTIAGLASGDSANVVINEGSSFNNAAGTGINVALTGTPGASASVELDNVTANNAGGDGVRINLTDASSGNTAISLTNVTATGATGGENLDIDVTGMNDAADNLELTIANSNFSGATTADNVNINLQGTAGAVTLAVDGVTASDSAGGDGFELTLDGGLNGNAGTLSGVVANNNQQNGVNVNVLNGSTLGALTSTGGSAQNNQLSGYNFNVDNGSTMLGFTASGLNLSNNGITGTNSAGLNVNVTNGSAADFHLTNLTVNNTVPNLGKGVQLNVQGPSTLNFTLDGTNTIANTGRAGLDINVGTASAGAVLTGHFQGLSVTNAGTAPAISASGIDVDVTGAGSLADLIFDQVASSNNATGDGFNVLVNDTASLELDIRNGSSGSNNRGRGLAVVADNATNVVLASTAGAGNVFNNNGQPGPALNGGHGVDILFRNAAGTTADLNLAASASGNAGDGIRIINNDGNGGTFTNLGITAANLSVNNNGGNGLRIDLDSVANVNSFDLSGATVTNNTGDQINVRFANMSLDTVDFSNVTATGAGAGVGTGNGISLTLDNSTVTNSLDLSNIAATNNGRDGLAVALRNGSVIPAGSVVDNGTFDNNGRHGVSFELNNSSAEVDFVENSLSNNAGKGLYVNLRQGSDLVTNLDALTISNNSDIGLHFDVRETSEVEINLGQNGLIAPQNLIENNVNAGIGIELYDNAQVRALNIANTAVRGTTAGSNANYSGDGFRAIVSVDQAVGATTRITNPVIGGADPLTSRTEFSGNAGRGVSFELLGDSRVLAPTIQNSVVSNNGSHGIEFKRFSNAYLDNVTIAGNEINNNSGDGIAMTLQGGFADIEASPPPTALVINVDVDGNQINSNSQNAVNFTLDADVRVNADVTDNSLVGSGLNGIRVRTSDDAHLDGVWEDNTIRNSGSDGVHVVAIERSQVGNNGGLTIATSEVSNSGRDGIRIEAIQSITGGFPPIVLANILDNRPQAFGETQGISNNAGSGINLISSSAGVVGVVADRNQIVNNAVDGLTATSSGGSQLVLAAAENIIQSNSLHGVNLNTSGFSGLSTELHDNLIRLNSQRGVSLVNTQNADSRLVITGSQIDHSNQGATATSRIEQNGSSGVFVENNAGQLSSTNNIDFKLIDTALIGNGANTGLPNDARHGAFLRVGTSWNGLVRADVQGNFFSGNGAIDFVTESFIATPDPAVANPYPATSASNNARDPLARLHLNLLNNTGDNIEVTRFGAYYSNADEYKSPAALFDSTSRRRNAQREHLDFLDLVSSTVIADPAPTTTTFSGGTIHGGMPNSTLTGLGVIINGNQRYISGYNAANGQITVAAIGQPAVDTPFTVFARGISGVGESTFRTTTSTVAAGGNNFTNVLTDFNSGWALNPGVPDAAPLFGVYSQDFTWQVDAGLVFP